MVAEVETEMGMETEGTVVMAMAVMVLHRRRGFVSTARFTSILPVRDAGQIAEAVVQHLNSIMDAEVIITLDIEARLPDGASDATIRTVTENAHTLKFDQFGFEEE